MYGLVDNNEWTLEKMTEINRSVSQNLEDDDATNNIYGVMLDNHSVQSMHFSAGLVLSKISDNGAIEIAGIADSDRNISVSEAITKLSHSLEADWENATARARSMNNFINQKSFMFASALYIGRTIKAKNVTFDYGVIVMPKFDSEQEKYISTTYGASLFGIPKTAKDIHCSAVILNAMNYLSYDSIVYSFFDIVMKGQIAHQPQDAKIMDLARDTLYVDFAFVLDGGDFRLIRDYMQAAKNKTSVKTLLDSSIPAGEIALQNIINFYNK